MRTPPDPRFRGPGRSPRKAVWESRVEAGGRVRYSAPGIPGSRAHGRFPGAEYRPWPPAGSQTPAAGESDRMHDLYRRGGQERQLAPQFVYPDASCHQRHPAARFSTEQF